MKRTIVAATVLAAAVAVTRNGVQLQLLPRDRKRPSSGGAPAGAGLLSTDRHGQDDQASGCRATPRRAGRPSSTRPTSASSRRPARRSTSSGSSGRTTRPSSTRRSPADSAIPDVVELGNTQTASYIAGGAFADLTSAKGELRELGHLAPGPRADSGTSPDGKLQAVPYYAGSRVVIYRKDLLRRPASRQPPTTLDELYADLDKVKAAHTQGPELLGVLHAGQELVRRDVVRLRRRRHDRLAAGRQVEGRAGQLGRRSRAWPQWQKLATTVLGRRRHQGRVRPGRDHGAGPRRRDPRQRLGGRRGDRHRRPATRRLRRSCRRSRCRAPQPASTRRPSSAAPTSPCRRRRPTSASARSGSRSSPTRTSQTALAKFAIPNTTSLLSVYEGQAQANQSTGEAAKNTWFVPNTPNWANVESGNVLQNALESIATGKASIAGGRGEGRADAQIATT